MDQEMPTTIKALSMWQPWASLVGTGAKQYETRSWSTNYRGQLLICSAKKKDLSSLRLLRDKAFQTGLRNNCEHCKGWTANIYGREVICEHCQPLTPRDLPYGEAIAIVDLVDVVPTGSMSRAGFGLYEVRYGDFHPGRFAWRLENVRRFPPGVEVRGAQGLFEVEVEPLVAQLGTMPMTLDLLHEAVSRL